MKKASQLIHKLTLKTYFSDPFDSPDKTKHQNIYLNDSYNNGNIYCKAFAKTTCTSVSRDEKGACHPFLQIKKVKRVVL